jgi:hypothetical protein
VGEVEGVQRDAERFQQRAVVVGELVGQRVQAVGRPGQELPQAAVAGAVPGEDHVGAQVAVPVPAGLADAARDGRVDRDPDAVVRSAADHARHLVTQHERAGHHGVADPALGEPVQVGAADPDRGHLDQPVVGTRRFRPVLGVHPHVPGAVQPGHPHAGFAHGWTLAPDSGGGSGASYR